MGKNRQQEQNLYNRHQHHHHHLEQNARHHAPASQHLRAHQQRLMPSNAGIMDAVVSTSSMDSTSSVETATTATPRAIANAQRHQQQHQQQHHQQQQQKQLIQQQRKSNPNLFVTPDLTGDDLHRQHASAAYQVAEINKFESRFLAGVLFTLAQLMMFGSVSLWLYWSYEHDDGLSWANERKQQFNLHAALMLAGFVFLGGQAMLVYRCSLACCAKIYAKIVHTILLILATSCIALGLILAYVAQDNVGPQLSQQVQQNQQVRASVRHFYSLHAWTGIAASVLFSLQFVVGLVSFLLTICCCQRASARFRAFLVPVHRTFGLTIMQLAIATALTGLLQTARSRLTSKLNKIDYHELAEPGLIINFIGVTLVALAIILPYIIRNTGPQSGGHSPTSGGHALMSHHAIGNVFVNDTSGTGSTSDASSASHSLLGSSPGSSSLTTGVAGLNGIGSAKASVNERLRLSHLDIRR